MTARVSDADRRQTDDGTADRLAQLSPHRAEFAKCRADLDTRRADLATCRADLTVSGDHRSLMVRAWAHSRHHRTVR